MVQEISKDAKTRASLIPGDVVSVEADDGKFAIMKILVMEDAGVYGLIYARLFTERPRIVNIDGLQIGHFALTHDHFARHRPELITHEEVTQEELRDYPFWATKVSGCGKSAGSERPGGLAVDEEAQDDAISPQVH